MLFKDCGCSFSETPLYHQTVTSGLFMDMVKLFLQTIGHSSKILILLLAVPAKSGEYFTMKAVQNLLLYFGEESQYSYHGHRREMLQIPEEVEWLWFYHWLTYTLALKYCFLGLCYIDPIVFLCVSSWKSCTSPMSDVWVIWVFVLLLLLLN